MFYFEYKSFLSPFYLRRCISDHPWKAPLVARHSRHYQEGWKWCLMLASDILLIIFSFNNELNFIYFATLPLALMGTTYPRQEGQGTFRCCCNNIIRFIRYSWVLYDCNYCSNFIYAILSVNFFTDSPDIAAKCHNRLNRVFERLTHFIGNILMKICEYLTIFALICYFICYFFFIFLSIYFFNTSHNK